MSTAAEIDEMKVCAARRAVVALGRSYEPLGRIQRIVIAFAAVAQAVKTLNVALALADQERILMQAAQTALAEAIAVAKLPKPQQLVMALKYRENLSDREIAAVLGCKEHEVDIRLQIAVSTLAMIRRRFF